MTYNEYLAARLASHLNKKAAGKVEGSPIIDFLGKQLTKATEFFTKQTVETLPLVLPVAGALTGVAAAKALSPQAVAENASNFAQEALERGSLLESLRELEALKVNNKLRKQLRKNIHDKFI